MSLIFLTIEFAVGIVTGRALEWYDYVTFGILYLADACCTRNSIERKKIDILKVIAILLKGDGGNDE